MRTPDRVPLRAPFTPQQAEVVDLVAQGVDFTDCAARLGLPYTTVVDRAKWAAKKIPGDLPTWPRIVVWHRGGTPEVLGAATNGGAK